MKRFNIILGISLGLIIAVTGAWAGGKGEKVEEKERLVFAVPVLVESNRTWTMLRNAHMQHYPYMETLLYNDPITAEPIPWLAERWEVNVDGTEWRFFLRKGVQFHFGFGEFTARDVVHSFEMITQEESISAIKLDAWDHATVEVVNDYEVVFRFDRPAMRSIGEKWFSLSIGDFLIYSKAQFDKEGLAGIDRKPAGTGPYQYFERVMAQSLAYEVFDDHWSGKTPDFKELEFRWVPEGSTRLAMLLAGEAHIVAIGRDLVDEALEAGKKVIAAQTMGQQSIVFIGGMYFRDEDRNYPERNLTQPWQADKRIRQALNMAIDRDELIEVVYKGRSERTVHFGFHPTHEGWNPEWEARFDDMYGYNPEKARALIKEAGYRPEDIKPKIFSASTPGSPELPLVTEALQLYFKDIGVEAEIIEQDMATGISRFVEYAAADYFLPLRNSPIRPTQTFIMTFLSSEGGFPAYRHDFIDEKFPNYAESLDLEARDEMAREIGNFLYDEFVWFPIATNRYEVVVDPEVVSSWVFPGTSSSQTTHVEDIKAVK